MWPSWNEKKKNHQNIATMSSMLGISDDPFEDVNNQRNDFYYAILKFFFSQNKLCKYKHNTETHVSCSSGFMNNCLCCVFVTCVDK